MFETGVDSVVLIVWWWWWWCKLYLIICWCRYDRVEHPSYPDSEIHHYPVQPAEFPGNIPKPSFASSSSSSSLGSHRQKARRHTHHTVTDRPVYLSYSSVGSSSISSEQGRPWELDTSDDIFIKTNSPPTLVEAEKTERVETAEKPSFRTLQSEDQRRPSVTVYQQEDSDHPDVKSIQNIVSNMTFSDPWWSSKITYI